MRNCGLFGAIALAAGMVDAKYISGEVQTIEAFTYGRFSTCIQNADKQGTATSFFTYWTGPDFSLQGWNEIVMEITPSISENPMNLNIFWEWKQPSHSYVEDFQPGTDWNDYAIEWTPTYVQWWVNDHVVRHQENSPEVAYLNKPQHLMMNFWNANSPSWGENFDDSDMPWYTRFDFVKIEKYNH